jgi:hypothetical protein
MARASLSATLLQPTNIVRKSEAFNLLKAFEWPIKGQKPFPSTVWREPMHNRGVFSHIK